MLCCGCSTIVVLHLSCLPRKEQLQYASPRSYLRGAHGQDRMSGNKTAMEGDLLQTTTHGQSWQSLIAVAS